MTDSTLHARTATAKKAVAKKAAPVTGAKSPKNATFGAAKKTAVKATASTAGVKKAPAKKITPAKKAPAKKTTPAKKATSGTATKKAEVEKAQPSKKTSRLRAARERALSAPMSKYFGRSRARAQKMLKDPDALKRIAEESYRSGAARSGPFADVMDDFRTLVRLVVAYARGNYREIPADSLVLVVAGLIYVVSPIDLIPDAIPGAGFMDDAVVVGFVIKSVRDELDQFRAWELGQETPAT